MRQLLDAFQPGRTIYLPGATGEITVLADRLKEAPDRMRGVDVLSYVLPGINTIDYAALADDATMTVFMLPPALRPSFAAGKVRLLPLAYSGTVRHLREKIRIDVAVAHVSPPDAAGRCSFGIAADFSPIAWKRAGCRVAVVNSRMPAMRRGPGVDLEEADIVVECDSPLIEMAAAPPEPALAAIARFAAELVPDGAAVQVGVGKAPVAIFAALGDHRRLRLRSGIAPAGVRSLAEAGALAAPDKHEVGIAGGPSDYYRWVCDSEMLAFADAGTTHNVAAIGALDAFHAINGAIGVDLLGQVNLQWQDGQLVSGVGGAPDFVRAAGQSRRGRSIVALPATAREGAVSRIVPRLTTPNISLTTAEVDTVVTEHGVAALRGRSIDERAAALIAIAGDTFRDDLARAWQTLRSQW